MFQKLLDMTIDTTSGIRKQDGFTVIVSVTNNPDGRKLKMSLLLSNWNAIASLFDAKNSVKIENVVKSCTETFNMDTDLESLTKFYKNNMANLGTAISGTKSSFQTLKPILIGWQKTKKKF
jgi:hypothetical protein